MEAFASWFSISPFHFIRGFFLFQFSRQNDPLILYIFPRMAPLPVISGFWIFYLIFFFENQNRRKEQKFEEKLIFLIQGLLFAHRSVRVIRRNTFFYNT